MTLYHTSTNVMGQKVSQIIPQPTTLASIAEVTLPEPEDTWLDTASKRFPPDVMFGDREKFILAAFRKALQDAPVRPDIHKRVPRYSFRKSFGEL